MTRQHTDFVGSVNRENMIPIDDEIGSLPRMTWRDRIREAREALGLTQRQLGDKIGSSQQTVGGWEKDATAQPNIEKWELLATALNTTPGWLAFGEKNAGPTAQPSDALNRDLIFKIIVKLERHLGRDYLGRPPEEKARHIIGVHDVAVAARNVSNIDEYLDNLIRLNKRP